MAVVLVLVNLAEREPRNQFWQRKRGASNPGVSGSKAYVENGMLASRVDVEDGPPVEPRVTRCVEGLEMGDHLLILQRCSIGWCRSPISNSNLVEEMCLEKIRGVHVMRISGLRVLLIFDSFEFRQQVVSSEVLDMWFSREDIILDCRRVWVSVFGEATLEPSSFERGRVLIETTVIDRIEERLEFSVGGRVFSVCISESDTLLHGPRVCRMRDNSSNSGESVSIGDEERIDREDVRGQDGATDALVPAVRDHEQLVDEAVNCVGPVVEGSNTEVLVSNGHKRKVRLLTDIISSLQTPEEKRKAAKAVQRRGHGRPCKSAISTSEIADISLNDSDLLGHVKLMELEWHRISEEASSPLSTLEKLRLLNGFLKVWNRESFGSVNLQIEVTTDLLNDLEGRDEGVEELHETRRQLQGNLWKLLRYRSSIWRQKSRVMWL
ncbi:hypothetical protein V6N11_083086 [Hibiscus sabdariffa]|uniref:DUF4283 domain-containing protein n=1 Tax=Hibiscus sabdariffa TaxID=183260 RepID=A0ABR2QL91_9ROSI